MPSEAYTRSGLNKVHVVVPPPPKAFSKAARSPRQEAQVSNNNRVGAGGIFTTAPQTELGGMFSKERRAQEAKSAKKAYLDLYAYIESSLAAAEHEAATGQQKGQYNNNTKSSATTQLNSPVDPLAPLSVAVDMGRDRLLCSSPRLHGAAQHRLEEVEKEGKKFAFETSVADASEKLTRGNRVMRDMETTPRAEGCSMSPEREDRKEYTADELGVTLHQQQQQQKQNQNRSPDKCTPREKAAMVHQQDFAPFLSQSERFPSANRQGPSSGGHYTVRYDVVDKHRPAVSLGGSHGPFLPTGLGGGHQGGLGNTITSEDSPTALRGKQKGKRTTPRVQPQGAEVSGQPTPSSQQAGEGATAGQKEEDKGSEDGQVLAAKGARPKEHNTSAFASQTPKILSCEHKHYCAAPGPYTNYNEAVVSKSYGTRTGSAPARGIRSCVEFSKITPRSVGSASSSRHGAGGSGAPEGYDAPPPPPPKGFVEFRKQTTREASARSQRNPPASARCLYRARPGVLSSNDPVSDGLSTDYMNINAPSVLSSRGSTGGGQKRILSFNKQTERKTLHNTIQFSTAELSETSLPKSQQKHVPLLDMTKLTPRPPLAIKNICRVEDYGPSYDAVLPHKSEVVFEHMGTHSDAQSAFSPSKLQRAGSPSNVAIGGYSVDGIKPKIAWNIDIEKVSPRKDNAKPSLDPVAIDTSKIDSELRKKRLQGDPMLGKCLSRAKTEEIRVKMQGGTTNDLQYENTSPKPPKVKGNIVFDHYLSREKIDGGRLGIELSKNDDVPGPGSYL